MRVGFTLPPNMALSGPSNTLLGRTGIAEQVNMLERRPISITLMEYSSP